MSELNQENFLCKQNQIVPKFVAKLCNCRICPRNHHSKNQMNRIILSYKKLFLKKLKICMFLMDDGSDNRVNNAFQIVSNYYRNQQAKFEIDISYIYTNEMSYNLWTHGRSLT